MIPDKTVVPEVKFTREFFKFLKLMLGDLEGSGAIPFVCEYYAEGKYADKQTEDGWPILDNFDEMKYPFHLAIGPVNKNGLSKLSVAQTPTTEGYKDNLLELLDMTEAGEDADIKDGILIGNLTAEQAYEYVSKKFAEGSENWGNSF